VSDKRGVFLTKEDWDIVLYGLDIALNEGFHGDLDDIQGDIENQLES
jgi:hypothetical protein